MAQVDKQIEPTDTCARCGLRRATRELEARGVFIRLCDDCYWGQEANAAERSDKPPAPVGPLSHPHQ